MPAQMLPEDLFIAARTLWGEARGEDYSGRLAVAHVFLNRWRTSKGQFRKDDTLATTCLRHVQFSVWNKSDPNFSKLMSVDLNNYDFRACIVIILQSYDSDLDPTKGARHYHTKHIVPSWSVGHTPCYETEGHVFYNDIP